MQQVSFNPNHKKTAIISYGNRITLFSDHVRSVDLIYLREYFLNVLKRDEVDFLSRKTNKEESLTYYKNIKDFISSDKINEYDELVVYNSPFNLFGGIFNVEMLDTLSAMLNFNGDIYYFSCDPKFPCVNIAEQIRGRIKNIENGIAKLPLGNDKFYDISIDDINRLSTEIWPNIIIAFAGINYELFCEVWHNSHKTKTLINTLNTDCRWVPLDLFTYYAVTELPELKLVDYDKSEVKYDLVYYGNNRHTERDKIIQKIYSDPTLNNIMFGYKMDWPNCFYHDYVAHDVLFEALCKNAWGTVILGDITHNNNIMTPRFFESMMLDLVGFVYEAYDKDKNFIMNDELREFVYFSDPNELYEKLAKIKNDKDFYKHIINLQRKEIMDRLGTDYKQFINKKIEVIEMKKPEVNNVLF